MTSVLTAEWVAWTGAADIIAPITVFVSSTRSKVSRIAGWDSTVITWSVDEACQAWQVRQVASASDTVAQGTLLASGAAVGAGVQQQTSVPSSSLTTGDGSKLIKVFAQDLAGNWSA